jgi:branched-chain amino acid transport system substrate-binding protein
MEQTKRRWFILGGIIIALFIIGGFLSKDHNSKKFGLDVAVVLPLSGASASVGEDFQQGMTIAEEEIQEKGINYHIEDTQTSPKEAVNALNKMLDGGNIDLVLALQAQVVSPIAHITEEKKLPLLASLSSLEDLTRVNKHVFLVYPLPETEINKAKEFINKNGYKRIAALTISDEFGETMKKKMIASYGDRIVASESYTIPEKDFRTNLNKIKSTKPDVIFVIGYPSHLIPILKQRVELGMGGIPMLGTMHLQSDFVRGSVGNLITDNVYAVAPSALVKGVNTEFVNKFYAEFGRKPDFMAPFGYDIVKLISQANKIGNGNIEDGLRKVSFKGLLAENLTFNQYGEIEMPLVVVKVKDRGIVL